MTSGEVFYLPTAGEYPLLSPPRACRCIGRLRDSQRDDYMLVEISPPLIGQPFGLGAQDVTTLLLATRHKDHTLFPIDEWPAYVYVMRFLVDAQQIISSGMFTRDQVQLLAWGMLFQRYDEAETAAHRWSTQLF